MIISSIEFHFCSNTCLFSTQNCAWCQWIGIAFVLSHYVTIATYRCVYFYQSLSYHNILFDTGGMYRSKDQYEQYILICYYVLSYHIDDRSVHWYGSIRWTMIFISYYHIFCYIQMKRDAAFFLIFSMQFYLFLSVWLFFCLSFLALCFLVFVLICRS